MGWAGELLKALNEIENDPGLTRDQLNQAVDAKVRELIERYRGEPLKDQRDTHRPVRCPNSMEISMPVEIEGQTYYKVSEASQLSGVSKSTIHR